MTSSVLPVLDEQQSTAVTELIEKVRLAGGRSPLNEDSLLALASPRAPARHLLASREGRLVGYGLVLQDNEPWRAQLVVDPEAPELADRLAREVLELAGDRAVHFWTHGRDSAVAPALKRAGVPQRRVLLSMARGLDAEPRLVAPPDGFRLRPFRVGSDEDAWLAGNAAAFASLGDQGGWRLADLVDRIAQPWFDAAGFLLLEAEGELAGFCWTKRHEEAGEIYVFAVLPGYQGRGLAARLLSAGLRHLWAAGCREADLYVDESNAAAVHLYTGAGFTVRDVDVLFATDP
jgi:mycothiol synthase